jgi:hypothetical protein
MSPCGDGRKGRLESVRVQYEGQWYERDLSLCRRARLVQEANGEDAVAFARRVEVGVGTVYAWLRGTLTCTRTTTDRMLAGLGLTFDQVHRAVDGPGADCER